MKLLAIFLYLRNAGLEALYVFEAYVFAEAQRYGLIFRVVFITEGNIGKLDAFKLVSRLVKAAKLDSVTAYCAFLHILINALYRNSLKAAIFKNGSALRSDAVIVIAYRVEHDAWQGAILDVNIPDKATALFRSLDFDAVH